MAGRGSPAGISPVTGSEEEQEEQEERIFLSARSTCWSLLLWLLGGGAHITQETTPEIATAAVEKAGDALQPTFSLLMCADKHYHEHAAEVVERFKKDKKDKKDKKSKKSKGGM